MAIAVYRASGNREKSLDLALALIYHHPENWMGYGRAAQDLAALKRNDEAQAKMQEGLDKFPNQVNILSIANDVYRASGNREKSLDFALGLIYHHPENWIGYGRAAQDLVALTRYDEAQAKIQEGLDRFPNQVNILSIANDVYRASGNREKSLDFALGLIYHHPENWIGYGRAAQDLVALKRYDEAQAKIQDGLDRFPNQVNILSIAKDVSRASDVPR
jgi:predicted Zn-dependent protease